MSDETTVNILARISAIELLLSREHLEVIAVANLLAGVGVNLDCFHENASITRSTAGCLRFLILIQCGDSRTLFPIQAALGYNLSQTLFIGTANLVVEGVTDFWLLSSVNDYFTESGKTPLIEKMELG
jgi:hypothetical protein